MKQRQQAISSSDSEAVKKHKEKLAQKLNLTKQAILQVLSENPMGVSLAQLPQHLKYKLQFALDLNELGFVKLKELLVTMQDQIKIELRGHNHPFAKLVRPQFAAAPPKFRLANSEDFGATQEKGHWPRLSDDTKYNAGLAAAGRMPSMGGGYKHYVDFNKQLEMIRTCIYSLLREFPPGIDSTKLPLLLHMRLGITFDWFAFGCSTLLEFMHKYVCSHYELDFIAINPYDNDQFVVRLKDAFAGYPGTAGFYGPYSSSSSYFPVHYRFDTDPNVLSRFPPAHPSPQPQSHSIDASHYLYGSRQGPGESQQRPTLSSGSTPVSHNASETAAGMLPGPIRL
jgi:hypothetical protein